jgi:ABC-type glycerol-3-phosphate transport system substrate-binding protein
MNVAAACRSPGTEPSDSLTIALAVFPGEAARYREFVREFERESGLRVHIVAQSYNDILQVVLAQAGGGTGTIDIAELDLSMLARARSAALPLDTVVTAEARELFPPAAWEVAEAGGELRFVPHRLMWQAMIYNRERIPNPPATWAELESLSRAHPGKFALKAARYEGLICDVMPFIWSAGGDALAPASAGSVRAMLFLEDLAPYLNPYSAVLREMSVLVAQARGEVWLHYNWPFAMSYLASKGLAPSVHASAAIPAGPVGSATPLGGGYLMVPRSAPHADAARNFVQFLLTVGTQRRLSEQLGWYGSVAPREGSDEALLFAGFTAMRDHVRARPVVPCYAQLSDRWQRSVRDVLFGNQTPTRALGDLERSGVVGLTSSTDEEACTCC